MGSIHVREEENPAPVRILTQIQPFAPVADPVEIGVSDEPHVPGFPGFRPVGSGDQPDRETGTARCRQSEDDDRGDQKPAT